MTVKNRWPDKVVIFVCDECGEEVDTDTTDFREALVIMKEEGWKPKQDYFNKWEHFCPECR